MSHHTVTRMRVVPAQTRALTACTKLRINNQTSMDSVAKFRARHCSGAQARTNTMATKAPAGIKGYRMLAD